MLKKLKGFLLGENTFGDFEEAQEFFYDILNYIEEGIDKPNDKYKELYDTFVDLYNYNGYVYRGVYDETGELKEHSKDELYSFTSKLDVAENFAIKDNCTGFVFRQYIENGLNLGELLLDFEDRGILSSDDVGSFWGEDEVICYINNTLEMIKTY